MLNMCLTRSSDGTQLRKVQLGQPLLDDYLAFVAARARPNTLLATAYDLKVFFEIVGKNPGEVTTADVLGFIASQRTPRHGDEVVRLDDGEAIESKSLVEATAQVLRLEVGKYRNRLIGIENRLRDLWYQPTEQPLQALCDDLEELNRQWLETLESAADHLNDSQIHLGDYSEVAAKLSEVLLGQTAQIETTISNMRNLDLSLDLGDCCRKLVLEIGRLIDMAHDLRDKMQETLVAVLRAERRLVGLEPELKTDKLTGLHNRTGVESVLFQWWREDVRRERLLSVALVDIDHFRKINERLGTEVGDKGVAAIGRLVAELISRDRGFDVASRFSGQQLLIFFGDMGPRQATSTIERVRQTLRQTTFLAEEGEFELTMSTGVTEVKATDTAVQLFTRAQTALKAAKKNGRNLTVLDEGAGPQLITPPEYSVRGRVVKVDN
jgi:diguanylate cyclase (GGDEF)-like protein